MRVLEALKILEKAALNCKRRSVDTPEVHHALDVLAPYCDPEWRITGFREHVKAHEGFAFNPSAEGQQQNLRVSAASTPTCNLAAQIAKLDGRYGKTKDATVKAELDRLTAELENLPNDGNSTSQKNRI